MKRICALVIPLLLTMITGTALAGKNVGGKALLSWNATSQVVDVAGAESPYLYVRFTNIKEFKGAEIDLVWSPPGNQADCFTIVSTSFRTSADCKYLNRGTTVPIVVADEPGHYHVAWANSDCASTCTEGAALQLLLDNTGCATTPGCFRLTQALTIDCVNVVDEIDVSNATCSVNGGDGGPLCPPPDAVESKTWGGIKALYR